MASIKLGDLLIKAKVLKESQLQAALLEQRRTGGKLGELLVRMEFLTEELLVRALSSQLTLQAVNLEAVQGVAPHVLARVPQALARELRVLPLQLKDEGKTLVFAMADPLDLRALDKLRAVTRCRTLVPQIAGPSAIARAQDRVYGNGAPAQEEGSFKVMDAQGRPVMRVAPAAPSVASRAPPEPPQPALRPSELLAQLEDVQRKEVATLKAMVELLIEKGLFTRDEYLAKVKR